MIEGWTGGKETPRCGPALFLFENIKQQNLKGDCALYKGLKVI